MTQFTCKGVKQINNQISFKHLYHSYLSAFFISAGVQKKNFGPAHISGTVVYQYCDHQVQEIRFGGQWAEGCSYTYLLTLPLYHLNTFTIHISRRFSSAREFQMGNFQKY
jgi:hypothetical protein